MLRIAQIHLGAKLGKFINITFVSCRAHILDLNSTTVRLSTHEWDWLLQTTAYLRSPSRFETSRIEFGLIALLIYLDVQQLILIASLGGYSTWAPSDPQKSTCCRRSEWLVGRPPPPSSCMSMILVLRLQKNHLISQKLISPCWTCIIARSYGSSSSLHMTRIVDWRRTQFDPAR